jgi:hypothetical protein
MPASMRAGGKAGHLSRVRTCISIDAGFGGRIALPSITLGRGPITT